MDIFNEVVKNNTPKSSNLKSMFLSFTVGGFIGMLGEILVNMYVFLFKIPVKDAQTFMIITMIFISSLLTAIGFFDKVIEKVKCGIIVPITGFAHAMMSSALEYKRDGFILGLGSNIFKITGSVILYGVVSSFTFSIIRIIIGV